MSLKYGEQGLLANTDTHCPEVLQWGKSYEATTPGAARDFMIENTASQDVLLKTNLPRNC